MDWLMIGFGVFFVASLVAAYNMGWHTGHDLHHNDDLPSHRKGGNLKPPKKPNLYV